MCVCSVTPSLSTSAHCGAFVYLVVSACVSVNCQLGIPVDLSFKDRMMKEHNTHIHLVANHTHTHTHSHTLTLIHTHAQRERAFRWSLMDGWMDGEMCVWVVCAGVHSGNGQRRFRVTCVSVCVCVERGVV